MRKRLFAAVCMGLAVAACVPAVNAYASTDHYANASTLKSREGWDSWVKDWNSIAKDDTKVSMAPGADETQLNFAWYSKAISGQKDTPIVLIGTDKSKLKKFTGKVNPVDKALTGGVSYVSNKVTVTGLKPGTKYYYTVEKNGIQSEVRSYTLSDTADTKILVVGDPQIGASKGQVQGTEQLVADDGVANTAARNDSYNWDRTLTIAASMNKDLDFIISAGDQINKTGKPKEEEYAGFLNANELQYLPLASTIGNHDSLNEDYGDHFNTPNQTGYGETKAGGDYYYSYGDGLFIVLNTNNYNVAEHEKTLQKAIASDPDAQWRIVTIHQDIYGSGLDHSDTDGMILRTQLTPLFDQYNVDVVLQGHDHTYSRSKLLYGDAQTHDNYKFQLMPDGSDYDWAHAFDVTTQAQITLEPEESDQSGQKALENFQNDNKCYTIENTQGDTVTNPKGTLYMTANSASGSKYYELISAQQDYIAKRSQNWLPSYSVIDMTKDHFAITTYQITEDNQVVPIDDTFTINKTNQ